MRHGQQSYLLARLLDSAFFRGAARSGLGGWLLGGARLLGCRSLGCLLNRALLLGRSGFAREVGEELDRRNLLGGLVCDHFEDALNHDLDLINRLVLAQVQIKLAKDLDWCLKVLARDRSDSIGGILVGPAGGDLARVLVEASLLRLLEVDIVGCARELLLDDTKLAMDQVELPNLPELLVVGRTLVVLAAEEGPVGNIARTSLVAAKVVRDDLAREVKTVLASEAARGFVVLADEVALVIGDILDIARLIVGRVRHDCVGRGADFLFLGGGDFLDRSGGRSDFGALFVKEVRDGHVVFASALLRRTGGGGVDQSSG